MQAPQQARTYNIQLYISYLYTATFRAPMRMDTADLDFIHSIPGWVYAASSCYNAANDGGNASVDNGDCKSAASVVVQLGFWTIRLL